MKKINLFGGSTAWHPKRHPKHNRLTERQLMKLIDCQLTTALKF